MKGTVEWISEKRDYCFIACEGNHYCIPISDIEKILWENIQPYDKVFFEGRRTPEGFKIEIISKFLRGRQYKQPGAAKSQYPPGL